MKRHADRTALLRSHARDAPLCPSLSQSLSVSLNLSLSPSDPRPCSVDKARRTKIDCVDRFARARLTNSFAFEHGGLLLRQGVGALGFHYAYHGAWQQRAS